MYYICNDAFPPENWGRSSSRSFFDSRGFFAICGLLPNGRGLPFLQRAPV